MVGRVFPEGIERARALPAIRALAQATGMDAAVAEADSLPFQYLVRARSAAVK
jgi:hypothetical protein